MSKNKTKFKSRVDIQINSPVNVLSSSEDEEMNINWEIGALAEEIRATERRIARIRARMRRLYRQKEKIRTRRELRRREQTIKNNLEKKYLPKLEHVAEERALIKQNLLNMICSSGSETDETELPTGQEFLDQLCGTSSGINLDELD